MLADIVTAPRYAAGVHRHCTVPSTMLRRDPDDAAVAVSALLFGEVFVVFDLTGGWAWGQGLHDHYIGWVRTAHLAAGDGAVSHRISVPAAPVFTAPDIKSATAGTLPLNARVGAVGIRDDGDMAFVAIDGGFLHHRHARPIDSPAADPVALALAFAGSPYVWGGRTRDGIDCSGLTQAVLAACGIFCPRDADQQGEAFAAVSPADRRRGDLVLFPGHVGILSDATTLVHANAFWMTTTAEPLDDVAARIAFTGFRRPPLMPLSPCSPD